MVFYGNVLNFKNFFNLSQNNILSASSQRSIVIFSGSQKSRVIFLNLTTLTKDAYRSTATTSVSPPCENFGLENFGLQNQNFQQKYWSLDHFFLKILVPLWKFWPYWFNCEKLVSTGSTVCLNLMILVAYSSFVILTTWQD